MPYLVSISQLEVFHHVLEQGSHPRVSRAVEQYDRRVLPVVWREVFAVGHMAPKGVFPSHSFGRQLPRHWWEYIRGRGNWSRLFLIDFVAWIIRWHWSLVDVALHIFDLSPAYIPDVHQCLPAAIGYYIHANYFPFVVHLGSRYTRVVVLP